MTLKICPGCTNTFDGTHYQVVCPTCYIECRNTGKCVVCGRSKLAHRVICQDCARAWGGTKKGDSTRCTTLTVKGKSCQNWALKGSYYCKQHQKK